MIGTPGDYQVFNNFITHYLPQGYVDINRSDFFLKEMEHQLEKRKQFFYLGDLIRLKILFISNGCKNILGINPDDFDLSTFIDRSHPEDKTRYALARVKIIKTGEEVFINKGGEGILSSHFRIMNAAGKYINMLFQGYVFHSPVPYQSVYLLLVVTDLSEFKVKTHGFHFYFGDDRSYFRYPDAELLRTGIFFTRQEFEILKLIAEGFASDQIAHKLSLSVNTINTHRRNIIKKTNSHSTHELIIELQQRGIL